MVLRELRRRFSASSQSFSWRFSMATTITERQSMCLVRVLESDLHSKMVCKCEQADLSTWARSTACLIFDSLD